MTITAPLVVAASNMFERWNREPVENQQGWWALVTLEEFQDALEDCPGGDYDTITEIVESRAKVLHQENASRSPVRDLVAALTECATALTIATERPWDSDVPLTDRSRRAAALMRRAAGHLHSAD